MKRVLRLLLPVTILTAVLLPGCYTVLMHPTDSDGYRASQVSDCTRCHSDYNAYPYGHYYSPYPRYWWDYPHYSGYYADPWWWSYYDYPYAGDESAGGDDDADSGTKFDRREASSPPTPPYVMPGLGSGRRPGELNLPTSDGFTGSGTVTGSSRPKTDSTGTTTTNTGTDEGNKPKDEKTARRETQDRPATNTDATVKPPDTKTQEPKKEEPKKEEKKSRRGGGKD